MSVHERAITDAHNLRCIKCGRENMVHCIMFFDGEAPKVQCLACGSECTEQEAKVHYRQWHPEPALVRCKHCGSSGEHYCPNDIARGGE